GSLSPARSKRRPRKTITPKSVEAACYEAVRAHTPLLRALLGDRDARVRGAAAFALAWFPDSGASAKAIAARCRTERDGAARVSMLIALGHLGANNERPELERIVEDGSLDSKTRAAAAIALVYLDGTRAKAEVRQVLASACASRSLRRTTQPWNGGDLAG